MCSKNQDCNVSNMFGYTLRQGVLFVGCFSTVVSLIELAVTAALVPYLASQPLNQHSLVAASLLVTLVVLGLSVFQLLLSSLLVWQALLTKKGKVFVCSVWYVAHVAVLAVYAALALATATVCWAEHRRGPLVATVCCASIYQGIFIYFCVVVNSYIHSMDVERYF